MIDECEFTPKTKLCQEPLQPFVEIDRSIFIRNDKD
jgi:hypothetical protein